MVPQNKRGKLFVVSAPSGAGKTTLANEVIRRTGKAYNISKVTTYTSRPPRNGEQNSKSYNFISPEKFSEYEGNGLFLETTEYNGKKYGSPASILTELEIGKSFILVVDLPGAKTVSSTVDDTILIWIDAPCIETLRNRMKKRNTETEKQINARLKLAKEEMKEAHQKQRLFKYHIVNEVFDNAATELETIIKDELK